MRFLLCLSAFLAVQGGLLRGNSADDDASLYADSLPESSEFDLFSMFLDRFHKRYENLQELENRFQIFRDNLRIISLHNLQPNVSFTMGINQFTDLTPSEFRKTYVSGLKRDTTTVGSYGCKAFATEATSTTPATLDWRDKHAVTTVKDQGQCGSCWTFSSTAAIEGAWAIATGKLVDLSEEQLAECATGMAYGSHGCNGGQMDGAFKYVISNGGQCTLSSYPYTSGNGKTSSCKTCTPVAQISGCYDVKPNDQLSLKAAVAMGPVSIAIEADTKYFQSYSGGILTSDACGTSLDHGVAIVGYGEDNGQKYWLVKNSWGTSWGMDGYVKIARSDSTNDPGICGIAMEPSFPVV